LEGEGIHESRPDDEAERNPVTIIHTFHNLEGQALQANQLALTDPYLRYQLDCQASFAIDLVDANKLFDGTYFISFSGLPWIKKSIPRLREED
jgi:hypothetical protein